MDSPATPPHRNPLHNLAWLGVPQNRRLPQPRRLVFDPIQVDEISSTVPDEEEEEEEEEEIEEIEDLDEAWGDIDWEPPQEAQPDHPEGRIRAAFLELTPPMIWEQNDTAILRSYLSRYEPDDQPETHAEIAYCEYMARAIRDRFQVLGVNPDMMDP